MYPARRRHTLTQRCTRQVVLCAAETRPQRQRFSVEHTVPPAGMRGSRGRAGQPSPAPPLLEKGHADAALPSELPSRGCALLTALRDLDTSIRGVGVHAQTLRLHRATAN